MSKFRTISKTLIYELIYDEVRSIWQRNGEEFMDKDVAIAAFRHYLYIFQDPTLDTSIPKPLDSKDEVLNNEKPESRKYLDQILNKK